MAHKEQKDFFDSVKDIFPKNFTNVRAIDCGSLDVNGSLKRMFDDSEYTGVDIVAGKNVDVVSHIKDLELSGFDTVVSGEMLEHDETWKDSLQKMYDMAKSGGLLAISCATEGRREHGTTRTNGKQWGTSPDYYMNLTEKHFREVFKGDMFSEMHFSTNNISHDIYFYGKKI